jgi:hypothetical protein
MTNVSGAGLFLFALQAYAVVIAGELLWRRWHGASWSGMAGDRFKEVVSLRWGLVFTPCVCFMASAASVILTLRGLWAVVFEAATFRAGTL